MRHLIKLSEDSWKVDLLPMTIIKDGIYNIILKDNIVQTCYTFEQVLIYVDSFEYR